MKNTTHPLFSLLEVKRQHITATWKVGHGTNAPLAQVEQGPVGQVHLLLPV